MGSFAADTEFSNENQRLRCPAEDRVKKIVLRTLDKIMSYLHYKTVANQRRMEWQETLMKTAAHP
jgi:hypothetical protein